MALSEAVQGRLFNWKFRQAQEAMERDIAAKGPEPTPPEKETVEALAAAFGNPGWFDGSMADIVRAAVWFLGVEDD